LIAVLSLTGLALPALDFLAATCWLLLPAAGGVECACGLLQAVDEVGMVLNHHFGEFFDFFILGMFLGKFGQLDFALVIDQQPICHDVRATAGLLLTAGGTRGWCDARLAGPGLPRLRWLGGLDLALLNARRLLCIGGLGHQHRHGDGGK
jgi:hypothetical protein